jgi:hypothetical protein
MSNELAILTLLRWLEVPITFSREDQWTSFSEPGRFPLVLKPVVAGSKLNKVLVDGGSGLNVLFTKTLKKIKLDITHMLTKSTLPFYGIVPGNTAVPLGSVVLPVTFGETRDNYRTEYVKFEVADFETSYHAILGRPAIAIHGGTPLHLLGIQDAKSSRCTLTARRLEDILRLRHRSCGTRSYESSTQRHDGDLHCIKEACPK